MNDQRGFTLVEMLVALSLFAAIAAMGVGLLRSSIDTQDAVQERLKGKVRIDFETSRRLFTLNCVLHWKGQDA